VRERLIDLLVARGEMELALEEYVALGESCYRLARMDSALDMYDQALVLADQTEAPAEWQVRILHRVADLQMQRVQWKEAARTYGQILALCPEDEQAKFRLIELQYRLGQESLALKDLDDLIVQRGKSGDLGALIRMLKELVASNPQDISIRSRLSRIYIELDMISEAVAELDSLAELQLEAGRKKEAIETVRTIVALEPAQKEGYTRLLSQLEKSVGRS
jgi:tetratricopeptide (TPR) repeat protein